jgi:polysaccharide export outer membrane protein
MSKTMRDVFLACALFTALAGVAVAQQSSPAQVSAPPLKVGSGDLIELTIYDNPDLSGHFRVDERGEIVVPLLGSVRVAGQTAAEIGRTIEKRYVEEAILPADRSYATVFISEYASQGITVSGEVKSPGLFPALGVRMLHDVMTAAGGVLITASSKVVITHKEDPDHPITVEYNPEALSPVIPQVQIFPGDSVMVPRAGLVYVLGNVMRPGAYVLGGRNSLTVEAAMALAGNTGKAASTKRVHLIRTQESGRKEDIILGVNLILQGKAPDVAMKDGDILYIPTSNTKLALQQAISSAIGIGTSVATYKTAYQ